jgi:hypothetical protein
MPSPPCQACLTYDVKAASPTNGLDKRLRRRPSSIGRLSKTFIVLIYFIMNTSIAHSSPNAFQGAATLHCTRAGAATKPTS